MIEKKKRFQWIGAVTLLAFSLLAAACGGSKPPVGAAQASNPPVIPVKAAEMANPPATQASTSTAGPAASDRQALKAMKDLCAAVRVGQACLLQGSVTVEAQPDRRLKRFKSAGDIIDLADLKRMKIGQSGSGEGLVWLRVPAQSPGASFTLLAFGDVELTNDVPFGVTEFEAMQSLTFSAGPADDLEQAFSRGLLVQAPHDGTINTLVINGMETAFASTAFFTTMGGFLSVNTIAGAVGLNLPDLLAVVVQGTVFNVPLDQLTRPLTDPGAAPELTPEQWAMLEDHFGIHLTDQPTTPDERAARLLQEIYDRYGYLMPKNPETIEDRENRMFAELIKKYLERQRQQRRWKGGWWKLTYGPSSSTGNCQQGGMVGDGGGSDSNGKVPEFSEEIPICRANGGRTLLFRDDGQVFERVTPNQYVSGWSDELKTYNGRQQSYVSTGNFQTLQMISPTRMRLNYVSAEAGGCTTTRSAYLDFLRDDPSIRCGRVIELPPWETPQPKPTEPAIEPTQPPERRGYTVRIGLPKQDCGAGAKAAASDFLKAGKATALLSLNPDGGLVMETGAERYVFTLGPAYRYTSQQTSNTINRLGLYGLEQPLTGPYQLSITLIAVAQGQYSGAWQVYNPDGEDYCVGSIDLEKPK